MNQKIAEVYQINEVNPLAGCLPSLVQIPIFIGLYRAVLDLAKENKLDEPFLWLPNLEGPVYGADPTKGLDWLFAGWVDGTPSLGWGDTIAFLTLPLFLVVSQYVSMEMMTPKDQQQQNNIVLKLLPLMIGWFSLNVPAALSLYWVVNNIVTTATSILIRNSMKMEPVALAQPSSTPRPKDIFAPPPMREKPAGFSTPATPPVDPSGVKPITAIDAEVVAEAKVQKKDDDEEDDDDDENDGTDEEPTSSQATDAKKKVRDLTFLTLSWKSDIFSLVQLFFGQPARRRQEKEKEEELRTAPRIVVLI